MTASETGSLPEGFSGLVKYVPDWSLATDSARAARRRAADFESVRAFYKDMLENMDAILAFLKSHPIDSKDPEARRLLWLTLSFCEVATAVELYRQAEVIDGFEPARFPRVEIPNMTPTDL